MDAKALSIIKCRFGHKRNLHAKQIHVFCFSSRWVCCKVYLCCLPRPSFSDKNKGFVFFHTLHKLFSVFPYWQLDSLLKNVKIFVWEQLAIEWVDLPTQVTGIADRSAEWINTLDQHKTNMVRLTFIRKHKIQQTKQSIY